MDIRFVWVRSASTNSGTALELKVREDADDLVLRACHPGIVTAYLDSTDSLEGSVNGALICKCGKCLAVFSGASDGSSLTWNE